MADATTTAPRQFLGHPIGLSTLFFTEMWERFSYYGMRALLVLFMTDAVRGGFGMDPARATAIYGLYTFGVYAAALPGGWIADRLIGTKRAVLYGGIVIAIGHYILAISNQTTFVVGLVVVVIGTGLLKPNVSAIVGDLYPEGGSRRDAGFSLFYSGINLGAFLGQLVCPFLGEKVDWHLGFGAAAIGMTFGVIQYWWGQRHLAGAGEVAPESATPQARAAAVRWLWAGLAVFGVTALALYLLDRGGVVTLTLVGFVRATYPIVAAIAILYFVVLIIFVCRDRIERGRIAVCAFLFLGAAIFWSGFEQAGSSLTLFARDLTDRNFFGWEFPAGGVQNANSVMIILLAPVLGMLWTWLGSRSPSIPLKFAMGLALLGAGFFVLAWGAQGATEQTPVGVRWLVVTYFFHTVGELCLSPVGLSSMTKLAPQRLVGQMMGVWFMGAALGNLIAGVAAGYIEELSYPSLFSAVAWFSLAGGVLFLVLTPVINRLAHGVR